MLGEAGATVYCTGRSARGVARRPGEGGGPFDIARRPETIEETAELVDAAGGRGIAVRVDHSIEEEVRALFERVRAEQGRLDILVNDIWGGDILTESKPFWELDVRRGLLMQERAVHTHIITARYGAPLLVEGRAGLIVEITDGIGADYRGNLFYDLAKVSAIRLAFAMAEELRPYGVAAVAVTPGFLRSEAMLEHFGVSEANWRDGALKDPHFVASETPAFVGRAVVALAADPSIMNKSGGAYSSWDLADEYGFDDIDGRRPHWGRHFAEHVAGAHDRL
jgi:NAD(P)-dependent dehydrogenase (short-subunit alcohol dehydrogenase family)